MRWLLSVLGGILVCAGIYVSVFPPANFSPLFLGTVMFLIGLGLIVTGIIWHRNSKETQTVTIEMSDEAEEEAEVLETLQDAVRHHLNPDEVLPKQKGRKKMDEKYFITLPKEERKLKKVKKR